MQPFARQFYDTYPGMDELSEIFAYDEVLSAKSGTLTFCSTTVNPYFQLKGILQS